MIARCLWFLTFGLFAGVGIGMVWWPASLTIAQLRSAAENDYDESLRNEAAVRQAAQLRTLHHKVVDDLRTLTPVNSTAAATATMLQLLSSEQRSYGVTVRSVVPNLAPENAVTARSASSEPFDRTTVEIALTGEFPKILDFVADVPRHAVLLDVRAISLADSGNAGVSPQLSVTLDATLYRFRGAMPQEDSDASASL